jgi:hypothetical protein
MRTGEAPARMEALEAENRMALAFAVREYN